MPRNKARSVKSEALGGKNEEPRSSPSAPGTPHSALREEVASKQTRKLRARRTKRDSVWFGMGMFGIVGWSVAIPAVIGAGLGLWIDTQRPSRFSWTLMLLFPGVVLGCVNAWYWVECERKRIEKVRDEKEDD